MSKSFHVYKFNEQGRDHGRPTDGSVLCALNQSSRLLLRHISLLLPLYKLSNLVYNGTTLAARVKEQSGKYESER